jgi:nucleotide-binding universal stress UspA family protein
MNPWKRLLIPLDGTEVSEWVLARANHLIEQPGLEVTLLAVLPSEQADAPPSAIQSSLARLRDRLLERSIVAEAELRFGDPASEILREISAGGHNLVAMATHGRRGLTRMIFGSVALQVLQASPVPLFLFRPLQRPDESLSPAESSEPARFRRVLVALDGSEAAEEILPPAAQFARAFGAKLHLFRSVPGGPGEAEQVARADEYLRNWQYSLSHQGLATFVTVRPGAAAEEALRVVRDESIDAVALTTHGHTGLPRALYGSVAERLLTDSGVPVLVLRNRRLRAPLPAPLHERRFLKVP